MDKQEVISQLFYDFYLNQFSKSYSLGFELDTELFHCIKKINCCSGYKNLAEFIKYCKEDFSESISKMLTIDDSDSLRFDKYMLHVPYSWFSNLQRFLIVNDAISKEKAYELLGINISDIYFITYAIVIRTITYAHTIINTEKNGIKRVFGTKRPHVWFSDKEIRRQLKNI